MFSYERKNHLMMFLRENKKNRNKINLVEYLQDRICTYATNETRPAEQIKGMNTLLRDIINLRDKEFEVDNK